MFLYFSSGGESTQSGTRYKQYQLDPNTGFITLAESIATPQDGFEMTVEATDGRNSALKSTAQIKIVYDTVNRPPQFVNCDQYKPTIREKQPPGTRVMTVNSYNYYVHQTCEICQISLLSGFQIHCVRQYYVKVVLFGIKYLLTSEMTIKFKSNF